MLRRGRAEELMAAMSERGWAFGQALLCAVLLSVALASSVFGYAHLSREEVERRAKGDLSRIRDELYVLRPPDTANFLLQAYGVKGPGTLPAPFSSIAVPDGAEIRAFVYLKRRRGSILLVSLSRGDVHYLWSDFYGNRRMQRIDGE